jgi:hypothetical protein
MKRLSLLVLALILPAAARAWPPCDEAVGWYESLRSIVLTSSPVTAGLPEGGPDLLPFAVIMDVDMGGETATLVSFKFGDTSLYLSVGDSLLDGNEHSRLAAAARRLNAAAAPALGAMRPVDAFPRPGRGDVTIFVLTTHGVFAATRRENILADGRDPLSSLFRAGRRAMSEAQRVRNAGGGERCTQP